MKESKAKLDEASNKAKQKKESGDWKKIPGRGGGSPHEENVVNARPLSALKDPSQFPAPPKKLPGPPQPVPPLQTHSTFQYEQPQYQQPQYQQPQYQQPQYQQPESTSQYQQPQYQQPPVSQNQYQQPAVQTQYQPPAAQYQPSPTQAGYQPPPPPGVQPHAGTPPQNQYQPPPPLPTQNQYQPPQSHYSPPPGPPLQDQHQPASQYQPPPPPTPQQAHSHYAPPPPPQQAQSSYAPPPPPPQQQTNSSYAPPPPLQQAHSNYASPPGPHPTSSGTPPLAAPALPSRNLSPLHPHLPPRGNTPEAEKALLPDPNSFPLPPRFGDPSSAAIHMPNQSTHAGPPPPQPGTTPTPPNDQSKPSLPDPTSFAPPPVFGRPQSSSPGNAPPPPPTRTSLSGPNHFSPPNSTTPTATTKSPPPPRPVARPDNPAPLPPRLPTRPSPPAPAPQHQPEFADAPPPSHPPPAYNVTEDLANQTRNLSIGGYEANAPSPQPNIAHNSPSPQPQQPNFAAEIANLRSHSSSKTSPIPPHVPPSGLKKKKPPPPPRPKKPHLLRTSTDGSISSTTTPNDASAPTAPAIAPSPPQLNLANKPAVPPPTPRQPPTVQGTGSNKRFDLELISAWFAKQPIQLPNDLQGYNQTYSTSYSGDDYALNIALRIPDDLSIVKFHLTWKNSNPLGTIQVQREDVPPPPELSPQELYNYSEQFGNQVASWAEAQKGTQVGNGECWTLAQQAIVHGTNNVGLGSQGLTHGALIYHINASSGGAASPLVHKEYIRRGDIIQYREVVFQSLESTSTCGSPDHTAVVTALDGDNINIVHQNTGGVKQVCSGAHNFAHMTAGDVKVFRVVPSSWAGELKA
ncbi:hypothetical protein TRVA0_025S01508 [Trichomonascus vanleenenianus]|uniref:uncharacterized protein n=1 Tax=Trichomonascus vanleenenianus TaxID=2268995 RepID=UPI003ECA2171